MSTVPYVYELSAGIGDVAQHECTNWDHALGSSARTETIGKAVTAGQLAFNQIWLYQQYLGEEADTSTK